MSQVSGQLKALGFIDKKEGKAYSYVSDAYRRFAAGKLKHLAQTVNDLFVEHYLSRPEEDEALANLSTLLVNQGRFAELVEYLSPERFAKLYQRAPTFKMVQQKADEGIRAAEHLRRVGDLVRFTLQRCTIEELAKSEATVSEIRARTGQRNERVVEGGGYVATS